MKYKALSIMKFLRTFFLCFTIWVLAALINTLLSGTMLLFFSIEFRSSISVFFLSLVFTLIFSIPAMFLFWLALIINWTHQHLFRILLRVGFITACLSLPLLIKLLDEEISTVIWLSIFIIISAIGAIMFHHSIIKSISLSNTIKE